MLMSVQVLIITIVIPKHFAPILKVLMFADVWEGTVVMEKIA